MDGLKKYKLTVRLGTHDSKEWWLAEHVDTGVAAAIAFCASTDAEAVYRFLALGLEDGRYYMLLEPGNAPAKALN